MHLKLEANAGDTPGTSTERQPALLAGVSQLFA